MRIIHAICSLICVSVLVSCMHVRRDESVTIDYGDSVVIKSSDIDRLWKPSYKYAICFPQNTTEEAYQDVSQLIANSKGKFTPQNTIILGALPQEQFTKLFPKYSVTNTTVITLPDSAIVAPVILGTIEAIKSGALNDRSDYKIIKRDTLLITPRKPMDAPANAIVSKSL